MTASSDENSPLLGQTQPAGYDGNGRDVSSAEGQPEEPKKVSSYFVYVGPLSQTLFLLTTHKEIR